MTGAERMRRELDRFFAIADLLYERELATFEAARLRVERDEFRARLRSINPTLLGQVSPDVEIWQ